MTIAQLEKEYADILNYKATKKVELRQNLFDISDTLYKENIFSKWYAFFFDTDEAHKLHDLFLSSLCELVHKKRGKRFEMAECSVYTEFPTGKGRIDLVIYSGEQKLEGEQEESYEKAIVIENKINASLNNDLQDYLDGVNTREDKVGVLLTLESMNPNNSEYVNITHIELARKIKDNLGNYLLNCVDMYLLYLKDFLATIKYITNTNEMDEEIKFYNKNSEAIDKLIAIRSKAYEHVIGSLKKELSESNLFRYSRKNENFIVLSIEETNLLLYISHKELYNSSQYYVNLWLNGESEIAFFDEIRKTEFEAALQDLLFEWEMEGKQWLYITSFRFDSPKENEFEVIGDFLIKGIKEIFTDFILHYKSEKLKIK